MKTRSLNYLLQLLILISVWGNCVSWPSWGWNKVSGTKETIKSHGRDFSDPVLADFSLKAADYREGIQVVENTKIKLATSNSCWQKAYQQIFAACSEIMSDDSEKRKRFAWDLSNCFQNDSGRSLFPHCPLNSRMQKCLGKLDDTCHQNYLKFFLETNTICYQLQAAAFRHQTERLVNDLKNAALFSEEKLENIERKSDELLRSSDNIRDSLQIVDQQTQKVYETTKHVSDHLNDVMEHSLAVFEQSQQITSFQEELKTGQEMMKINLEQGMTTLHESYNNLGERMNDIKTETIKVEKKISEVGDAVSEKMVTLEVKADDIGKKTGISLDNQKQLLDIQSIALQGLQSLSQFQSEALMESRASLKELAEFGHKQQDMLLQRQDQLKRSHDSLVENFKSMLAAQEEFEAKQAHMFIALDKLFSLHNAMLVESRLIKAFFIYCIAMFLLYVLTSTKQTYTVRPKLYMGLCGSLLVEIVVVRFLSTNDIEQQMSIVNVVRWLYVSLASVQLLYSICTYRDYELLNHQMLVTLMDKVNGMRSSDCVSDKLMCDSDSDVDWDSWVDTDIPDDVNNLEDPDYAVPGAEFDNMLAVLPLKTYHLRRRPH